MKSGRIFPLLFLGLTPLVSFAQTNNWNSPVTGNWHDLSWSLGVRPQSNHWANVTNSGSKAVIVNAITRDNYRASMTVSNFVVGAPSNATNTVLLNFTGTTVPFTVLKNCFVRDHGVLLNLSAGLTVGKTNDGLLAIEGGTVNQSGGSNIVHGVCRVGDDFVRGEYGLTNGVFQTGSLEIYSEQSASFHQLGGQTIADNISIGRIGRSGGFGVSNGVVRSGSISIDAGGMSQVNSEVVCSNGLFVTSEGRHISSSYSMAGGSLSVASLDVSGYDDGYSDYSFANFTVDSGTFTTETIQRGRLSTIFQNGGTISVRGAVLGGIKQTGGLLMSSNTYIYSPDYYYGGVIAIDQTGGTNITTNSFQISSPYNGHLLFNLQAGRLDVSNLVVNGNTDFLHSGGTFTNRGQVQLGGGALYVVLTQESFGPLNLQPEWPDYRTTSYLHFPSGNSTIRFRNSAGVTWNDAASLEVDGWAGSTNGGGASQLIFGPNGLTPAQLGRIVFSSPAGFSSGSYNAKLLSTGEVVPTTIPYLVVSRSGSAMTLDWLGTHELQTATNVAGPYSTIVNPPRPYEVTLEEGKRFFRLRN